MNLNDAGLLNETDLEEVVEYALGWVPESGPIRDWYDLLDRIESACDVDLGDHVGTPVIVQIKSAVRQARKERGDG